jgi:hypothetical protein
VDVRYRMHNTGSKVQQDFFFPVERWGRNPDADTDTKSADIGDYQITVDRRKLPWTNVLGPKEETSETTSLIPLILEAGFPWMDFGADKSDLGGAEGFPSSAAAASSPFRPITDNCKGPARPPNPDPDRACE